MTDHGLYSHGHHLVGSLPGLLAGLLVRGVGREVGEVDGRGQENCCTVVVGRQNCWHYCSKVLVWKLVAFSFGLVDRTIGPSLCYFGLCYFLKVLGVDLASNTIRYHSYLSWPAGPGGWEG